MTTNTNTEAGSDCQRRLTTSSGEQVGEHPLVMLFKRDGFYAVQNWASYGSIERIVQISGGLVMFKKDDWVSVQEFFGEMGEITVQYLDSFEA